MTTFPNLDAMFGGVKVLRSCDQPIYCTGCGGGITPGMRFITKRAGYFHEDCQGAAAPPSPVEPVFDDRFVDALIKRSEAAELVSMDSGRIRLLGTAKAAVELYLEIIAEASAGRTE